VENDQAQSVSGWGLLANGAAGQWSIDIDESTDGAAFNMQLDGPQFYLGFALQDLQIIPRLRSYLCAGLRSGQPDDEPSADEKANGLAIGRFDSMTVSIIQDDEFATRWFIIINGQADAVVRFTLDAADVEMLVEALGQVMGDLAAFRTT
jgi:hypothetical protein